MGTYTDFFVGSDVEIREAFSWLFPVVEEQIEPVDPRPLINPFTKQPLIDPRTGAPEMSKRLTTKTVVQVPADVDTERGATEADKARMAKLPHLLWKNASIWEVSILCQVVFGEDDWLDRIKPFLSSSDMQSTVYRLPNELTKALSKMGDEDFVKIGALWLGHEELRDSWRIEDGRDMVKALSDIARLAVRGSKDIFLQM